jgi:hypothetical protein
MKKIILTAVLAISTVSLFAQATTSGGLMSKKGEMYLPQAGDWSISFDAAPFLNYFGNMLSSAGNHAPTAQFLNGNNTIMGKYFVDDQTAYRGIIRIGFDHYGVDNMIYQDNYAGTPPTPQVTDHASVATHFIGLGVGMEKRRGKNRLQGYYGAEFMFMLMGESQSFTYGNAVSTTDPSPTSTPWAIAGTGTNVTITPGTAAATPARTTSNDAGSTFGLSLQGFIGFEYFFAPKISVGAEYTWGVGFSSTGQGSMTQEGWNGTADQSVTTKTGGNSFFGVDTGINSMWGDPTGNLYINFHF